jgi:hypothetical protein
MAKALLLGVPVAKADPPAADPDPDSPTPPTPGSMSEEEMEAARKEAQSAQPAPGAGADGSGAAPADPAAGAPDGSPEHEGAESPAAEADEHASGQEPDDEVTKSEILKSMHFLAETYKIGPEEIAKSFSGLEGDPAVGKEPVGKGVEYLEGLLKKQSDILERMAGFMQELCQHTVKLGDQVSKSIETSEVAKSLAEKASAEVDALPKIATAKTAKGASAEEIVAKAESGQDKKLTGEQLFKMALDPKCPLSPQDMARTNRAAQGTYGA